MELWLENFKRYSPKAFQYPLRVISRWNERRAVIVAELPCFQYPLRVISRWNVGGWAVLPPVPAFQYPLRVISRWNQTPRRAQLGATLAFQHPLRVISRWNPVAEWSDIEGICLSVPSAGDQSLEPLTA